MKIEVPQATIDKMMKSRVTAFNKKIRDLEAKLKRRDNKIHKLKKEIESLKGDLMVQQGEPAITIAKIAAALVSQMEEANWIQRIHDCEEQGYCDCKDFY